MLFTSIHTRNSLADASVYRSIASGGDLRFQDGLLPVAGDWWVVRVLGHPAAIGHLADGLGSARVLSRTGRQHAMESRHYGPSLSTGRPPRTAQLASPTAS